MKLGKHVDIVTFLLKSNAVYRDNDNKLIARIWHETLKAENISTRDITAFKFLKILGTDKLPAAESIRRCRQKAQQHDKSLRGDKWKKRQVHQTSIKNELKGMQNTLSGA